MGSFVRALVILFVLAGLAVAVFSIYNASVDGVMKNTGLVGADFGGSVAPDKMNTLTSRIKQNVECNFISRAQGAVTFFLSGDDEQGKLAFQLASSRVNCGAQMLARGDVETGTYEILKGMAYLIKGYTFVKERAGIDRRACLGLPDSSITEIMTEIFDATNGQVYETLWSNWQDVSRLAAEVDSLCLDQRINSR